MRNLPRAVYDTLIVGLVILTIVISVVVNTLYCHRAVNTANHRWCATLSLLTEKPPPKNAPNDGYRLYLGFKELQHDFGCTER